MGAKGLGVQNKIVGFARRGAQNVLNAQLKYLCFGGKY